ncbi:MAG: phosphoesterase PA-phosphatase, partial [Micromonosporaceae bacterium]|nr:phosphoesterase PA-phosphatase [Micromonosporaceae bacterium]
MDLTRAGRGPVAARRLQRLARVVTELCAPAVVVGLLLVVMGWYTASHPLAGLAHGAIAAVFESVLPFAYIVRGVRSGELSDHHVGVRSQRARPLLIGLGSATIGLGVLVALGAARPLVAAVVAGGAGLVVSVVVSHWWKMSIHAAVASGAAMIAALVVGVPWVVLGLLPLVALVGWS